MPLPLILGVGAAIAGAAGVGSGIHGVVKMNEANDTMKSADERHKRNIRRFEKCNKEAIEEMDKLGQKEMTILKEFEEFSRIIEKIQNKPDFKSYTKDGVKIPTYNKEELEEVWIGAGILLGVAGGATVGTFGGVAAAGATAAAVMAFGTASTGTAISALGGAAATNATLAALGGGALAAGGGGMALGSAILGGATLGVGLLIGGIIFNSTGSKLSDKADEAWSQMKRAEKEIDTSCIYLNELYKAAEEYLEAISSVETVYKRKLKNLSRIVEVNGKTNWFDFLQYERVLVENTSMLVGLLYSMCKVKLVLQGDSEKDMNEVNKKGIEESIKQADAVLEEMNL
ncbi:MAG: hypothetical protein R3Y24_16270 [Eubacteriales bacterium]